MAEDRDLEGRVAWVTGVTTWSDVPDDVAFAMSWRFYEAFLRGETVGAALREARVRLLLEKKNPLGLPYTVYGDSRFRLTRPRTEEGDHERVESRGNAAQSRETIRDEDQDEGDRRPGGPLDSGRHHRAPRDGDHFGFG